MASFLQTPSHPGLLPKWLLLTAAVSVFNSVQNLVTDNLTRQVYSRQPDLVNGLSSRTFAVWTLLAGIVRYHVAYHITEPAWYNLAIATYLVGLAHFTSELFIFKTAAPGRGVYSPLIVASISLGWLLSQWGYYVQ